MWTCYSPQVFYNDQQARQDAALIEARRRRVSGTTNKHGMVIADRGDNRTEGC